MSSLSASVGRFVSTILSSIGAALILLAFWMLQTERLRPMHTGYLLMNLVGAGLLAAAAAMTSSWAFVVLNTVWALVALRALAAHRRP
jgi:hypothetical protein